MNEAAFVKRCNTQESCNKQERCNKQKDQPTVDGRARRHALLAAMLSASALMSIRSGSLPTVWTRPVINAVLTPAHAQTSLQSMSQPRPEPPSETAARFFAATGLRGMISATHRNNHRAGQLLANLNQVWLAPAHASTGTPLSFCQRIDPIFEGAFDLYFTVISDNQVNIAVQGDPAFRVGDTETVCAATTTLAVDVLADTDIQLGLGAGEDDPDCVIRLFGMQLIDEVVSGSWLLLLPDERPSQNEFPKSCEGAFIAEPVDAAPIARDCRGLFLQI